jgi:DNA replication protein DnaC
MSQMHYADQLERTIAFAGVPPRFADRRLDTFNPGRITGGQRALDACRALIEKPAGLILSGPTGVGKTHLYAGLVVARAEAWLARYPNLKVDLPDGRVSLRPDFSDRFANVADLLDRINVWYRGDAEDPLPELVRADLLILDDLGREKSTERSAERLYVLVNRRYERCLPTCVATNYTVDELTQRGYDVIVSRIVEGGGRVIALGKASEDQRMRGSK